MLRIRFELKVYFTILVGYILFLLYFKINIKFIFFSTYHIIKKEKLFCEYPFPSRRSLCGYADMANVRCMVGGFNNFSTSHNRYFEKRKKTPCFLETPQFCLKSAFLLTDYRNTTFVWIHNLKIF